MLGTAVAVALFMEPAGSLPFGRARDVAALLISLFTSLLSATVLESMHGLLARAILQSQLAAANRQLQASAEERETLLSEAVHRARNDLQRLSATLQLQARSSSAPDTRRALFEATDRIKALAAINDRLDRHREDGNAEVETRGFVEGLAQDLREGAVGLRPVVLSAAAESHVITMARAVPIGLVLNELVGNALKCAFPDEVEGQIRIGFRREGEEFVLTVEANGIGFDPGSRPQGSGLGAKLSRAFAGQLGGRLEVAPAIPAPTDRAPAGRCGSPSKKNRAALPQPLRERVGEASRLNVC